MQSKKPKKIRLASVSYTRWAFYEAMDNAELETMSDWFETLFIHYKNRGKR